MIIRPSTKLAGAPVVSLVVECYADLFVLEYLKENLKGYCFEFSNENETGISFKLQEDDATCLKS